MTEKTDKPTDKPTDKKADTKPAFTFSLSVTSGPEQTPIAITGGPFGDSAGDLRLNEVPMPVVAWTNAAIDTHVPYGATSGDVVVIRKDGARAAVPFTVTEKDA